MGSKKSDTAVMKRTVICPNGETFDRGDEAKLSDLKRSKVDPKHYTVETEADAPEEGEVADRNVQQPK